MRGASVSIAIVTWFLPAACLRRENSSLQIGETASQIFGDYALENLRFGGGRPFYWPDRKRRSGRLHPEKSLVPGDSGWITRHTMVRATVSSSTCVRNADDSLRAEHIKHREKVSPQGNSGKSWPYDRRFRSCGFHASKSIKRSPVFPNYPARMNNLPKLRGSPYISAPTTASPSRLHLLFQMRTNWVGHTFRHTTSRSELEPRSASC
jgi:hypothetical protein